MSRRRRTSALNLRNIYAIWIGILIVFIVHTLVAFTEENIIQSELEELGNNVNSYRRHDKYRTKNSESEERFVTVKRNVSKVEDSEHGNVPDTRPNNGSELTVRSKLQLKGRFGKQDEFENIRAEYYRNKTRPASCDHCFQTNFTFDSSNICNSSGGLDKVDIIIVIPTAYTHIRQRMALRTTWLSRTMKNTAKVRYAFILGQTNIKQMQHATLKEKEKYNDMVIANFTDNYMNLTLKTLAAFHWIRAWCPQARVVVKADDDVFMNLESLIFFSGKNLRPMQQSLYGGCWVRQPIRRPESKYYVSNSTYSNATYPEVCSGTTYVTSAKVIEKILKVSPDIPFFYLEDVYVAFCMEKAGIKAKKHMGILTKAIKADIPLCAYKGSQLISAHIRNPRKIEQIWRTKCDKKKPETK